MKDLILLNDDKLKKLLAKMHALDIANIIKQASPDLQMRIINLMSLAKTNDVFMELPKELTRNYFNMLTENQKRVFLNEFEMDELKVFINTFDEVYQEYLIKLLSQRKQKTLKLLMGFDSENIASIMTTEFVTIDINQTIKEATSHVVTTSAKSDYIDSIFVLSNNELIGSILLKDLISARPNDKLADLVFTTNEFLTINDSVYQGFTKFKNYGLSVLPVLDDNKNIIGIVTADDILDELILGYEDDIEKMQSIGDFDEESSPLKRSKQRMPWLLVSVILNLVIALFLVVFERTIEEVIALILFQPMILGMAGNIGTQAISVTILKLNQDEMVGNYEQKKHVKKELGIGMLNSIAIGIAGMVIAYIVMNILNIGNKEPFDIALTVGLSLFGSMLLSAAFGVFIPIILTKFKVDPAAASGPIISTLNDLFALVVYFGIATLIFMM